MLPFSRKELGSILILLRAETFSPAVNQPGGHKKKAELIAPPFPTFKSLKKLKYEL